MGSIKVAIFADNSAGCQASTGFRAMNGYALSPDYVENGRTYHGYHKRQYMFPCDEEEKDHMSIGHMIINYARVGRWLGVGVTEDKLHSAPINTNQNDIRILDLGCGEGHWVFDMAKAYPTANIYGMDLAKIQPKDSLPRNVDFIAPRDYEEALWGLGENSFDLIRLCLGCGSVGNWEKLYRNILTHLKPGIGHFEQIEMDFEFRCDDGSMPTDCPLKWWYGDLKNATRRARRPIQYNTMSRSMLESVGFKDVGEEVIQVPVNTWPSDMHKKQLGFWYTGWMEERALEGLSMQPLTLVAEKSPDEVRTAARGAAEDIRRTKYHTFNEL